MIGGYNETLLLFKIDKDNSLNPKADGKFKMSQCVNCIVALDDQHYLLGQDEGHIAIFNIISKKVVNKPF
jgi:hypothetical protein